MVFARQRERDGRSYRDDTVSTSSTDADTALLRRCFLPALPASASPTWWMPTTNEAVPCCSYCHRWAGAVALATTRQSTPLASTGLSWLLNVCIVCMDALSSSSLAAILSGWRFHVWITACMSVIMARINQGGWIRRWCNRIIESMLSDRRDCQWYSYYAVL